MPATKLSKGKLAAIGIVALLIAAGVLYLFLRGGLVDDAEGKATIDDLISSRSQRTSFSPEIVISSYGDRFYTLIATPAAAYYSGKDLSSVPLLVAGENPSTQDESVSTSVTRFLDAYPASSGIVIGPLDDDVRTRLLTSGFSPIRELNGDPRAVSIAAARAFWTSSDGAVLVHDSDQGYETGLPATTLASYLNIPIIVTPELDSRVRGLLTDLGVRYTIVCGPLNGYGKVMRVDCHETVLNALALGMESKDGSMRSLMRDRLSITPDYIVMADPMDTMEPVVEKSFSEHFEGTVSSTDTGSTSDPSLTPDAGIHHVKVPEDYQWARVKARLVVDFVDSPLPTRTAEDDGQRGYMYFGVDEDLDGAILTDTDSENDHLEFMVPTLAYSYVREGGEAVAGMAYTEEPLFNAQGIHAVEVLATLAYDPLGRPQSTTYTIDVTVEKLSFPNHVLSPNSSVCAPYLAVNRGGLLLSCEEFSIYTHPSLLEQRYAGDPSEDHRSYDEGAMSPGGMIKMSNDVAVTTKGRLNGLLAGLAGLDPSDTSGLAAYYGDRLEETPFYVGIVGDTNMVPQFYYPTSGQGILPQEGYAVAGDLFYSSIDADPDSPPNDLGGAPSSTEIAVGRITGWDAQDISALISRTLFYDSILDSFSGLLGQTWKDSAMNNFGSKIPVGTSITVTEKITEAEERVGFTVDHKHYVVLSDSRLTRDLYQSSNFIYFCAHGFYYWFVPPGYKPTSVGGSYNVANVVDMNFGPSVIWGSSCVTGKTDGIQGYNGVSLAFLHSGMNTYIGASRLSWGSAAIVPDMESGEAFGSYIGLLFYGYLCGYLYDKQGSLIMEMEGDMTVGQSFALAKNVFVEKEGYGAGDANADTIEEFNLLGDPAFDPYEPDHMG